MAGVPQACHNGTVQAVQAGTWWHLSSSSSYQAPAALTLRRAEAATEFSSGADCVEVARQRVEIVGIQVAVAVECHLSAAVTELRLHCFDRCSGSDEEAGAGVPHDVDSGGPTFSHQPTHEAFGYVESLGHGRHVEQTVLHVFHVDCKPGATAYGDTRTAGSPGEPASVYLRVGGFAVMGAGPKT